MAKRSSGLRFQPSGGSRGPMLPVGKKQLLDIQRQAGDGRGIAFEGGRTWFVSGALAGERVEARVLSARSQTVEAKVERVLNANAQRRETPCPHAERCGGCSLQHISHADQVALKQQTLAEQLSRLGGVTPERWAEPLQGPELGYRRRARIAVRWDVKAKRLDVGFRAEASQDIVSVSQCPVLVQPLQPIFSALPKLLRQFDKPQVIGHVELFSGTAQSLLLRHTAPLAEADLVRLRAFCAEHNAQLWLQGESEPQADDPTQSLAFSLPQWGLELAYRPGDFVQVNGFVNQAMVAQALEWLAVKPGERVLDLFCGLGNFGLPLAKEGAEVTAVEGVQAMVERAAGNAQAHGLSAQFVRADLAMPLAQTAWARKGFDAVMLDPPREGAFEVVRGMADLGAQRLVYVSCNPTTLARDAAELVKQGYQLRCAGVLDMFPQTAHIEAMALFERG